MAIKKKLTILLIVTLSVCLFFAFGFQIDVSGAISKEGGTADVSPIEPLRVAAEDAQAAVDAAQLALDEANVALAIVKLILGDSTALEAAKKAVFDAEADVIAEQLLVDKAVAELELLEAEEPAVDLEKIEAAEKAVKDAQAAVDAAQLALDEAKEALAIVELILGDPTALETALKAVEDAEAALEAAKSASDAALVAFSGLKARNTEELEALQKILEEAEAALKEAMDAVVVYEKLVAELELAVEEAGTALEEFEPGQERIMYSHIIINSNNGGSFNEEEGNHSGVDGDLKQFTFDSEDGFDLVWLRIGNIKIETTEGILEYLESFDKKNLTIHAHFKKNKDYSPVITTEETGPEEDAGSGDEDGDEKGNGKGKDKEKSNNGRKK